MTAVYPCHIREPDADLINDSVVHQDALHRFTMADVFLRSRHPDIQMFWRQVLYHGWRGLEFDATVDGNDFDALWISLGGRHFVVDYAFECLRTLRETLPELHGANLVPFRDFDDYAEAIKAEMSAAFLASSSRSDATRRWFDIAAKANSAGSEMRFKQDARHPAHRADAIQAMAVDPDGPAYPPGDMFAAACVESALESILLARSHERHSRNLSTTG